MTQYLARSPMVAFGVKIARGERVPMEKFTGDRRRQLIEQNKVVKDSTKVRSRRR